MTSLINYLWSSLRLPGLEPLNPLPSTKRLMTDPKEQACLVIAGVLGLLMVVSASPQIHSELTGCGTHRHQ